VVYDLERRVLLWVGDDRTEEAVKPFFTTEMGTRRCHTLRVIFPATLAFEHPLKSFRHEDAGVG
jgi:hypothetical protein